jgi:hypothetical protein
MAVMGREGGEEGGTSFCPRGWLGSHSLYSVGCLPVLTFSYCAYVEIVPPVISLQNSTPLENHLEHFRTIRALTFDIR